MGIAHQFATNHNLERKGVAMKFDANADKTVPTLFVARTFIDSQEYRTIFERESKPFRHEIDSKTISEADDLRLMVTVFVKASVRGWCNVRLPDGFAGIGRGDRGKESDIEYSENNAIEMFCALPDLFREVAARSGNADNFRAGAFEVAAKN